MDNLNSNLIQNEIQKFQNASDDSQLETIKKMKQELQESIKKREEYEDPDNILYKNIDRANRMLDILEDNIKDRTGYIDINDEDDKKKKKKISDSLAKLFEVTALLINSITTATNSIAGSFKDDLDYQYKLELLAIERQKLVVKYALGKKDMKNIGGGELNSDTITMNREDLLKMINNESGKDV